MSTEEKNYLQYKKNASLLKVDFLSHLDPDTLLQPRMHHLVISLHFIPHWIQASCNPKQSGTSACVFLYDTTLCEDLGGI